MLGGSCSTRAEEAASTVVMRSPLVYCAASAAEALTRAGNPGPALRYPETESGRGPKAAPRAPRPSRAGAAATIPRDLRTDLGRTGCPHLAVVYWPRLTPCPYHRFSGRLTRPADPRPLTGRHDNWFAIARPAQRRDEMNRTPPPEVGPHDGTRFTPEAVNRYRGFAGRCAACRAGVSGGIPLTQQRLHHG